ncbi:MAG: hypothetical protein PF569_04430 [Candidatus Woesearchaeota archaeon]|jgi:hypothetical protein|nr:hypothetical protein [Candidatus Woesearchaeota archaeon]
MATLIAMLSSGKGTWGHVNSLISLGKWDRVYLICNDFSYDNFEVKSQNIIKLKIDEKNIEKSLRILSGFLKKEVQDFEVGLNLVSGSGIEHMIVLSSVLKAGLGLRFVYSENNEIKEVELLDEKYIPQEELF